MFQLSKRSIPFLLFIGFFVSRPAHAYLDPSTITAATQVVAAFCTWFVLGFVFFRNQVVKIFSKIRSMTKKN